MSLTQLIRKVRQFKHYSKSLYMSSINYQGGGYNMPWRPQKRCPYSNCQAKTEAHEWYCQRHLKLTREEYDKYRPNASQRGYNSRWQQIRIRYLNRHPLCIDCLEADRTEPATMVHHLLPLRQGGKHVSSNLVALCVSCHAKREAVA